MIHTSKDISRMLADKVESVCRMLLPAGKQVGNEWCAGSVDGDAGKSLKVCLHGPKVGVWADFAGNDKGDILDLWRSVKRQNGSEAFIDASKWLGIWHESVTNPQKQFSKPIKPQGMRKLQPLSPVFAYLQEQRKLTTETLSDYRICEKGNDIIFQYISPAGVLINLKHLAISRKDGQKTTRLENGCALILFGWQTIKDGCKELIICEGEIDAMTWHQFGFPALSVPNGCTSVNWIELEWDNLAPLDTIWLSYDMDEAGKAGAKKVAERLGLHRCQLIELPHKDANECLQKGCIQKDAQSWIARSKSLRPPEICNPSFFSNEVEEFFYPSGKRPAGHVSKMLGAGMMFRPGEVTLFTGVSSHGKSTVWSNLLVEAAAEGKKIAIASLEIPPHITLAIMAKQWHGIEQPTQEQLRNFFAVLSGRIWVFDIFGIAEPVKLLALCEYSRARFDVDFIVIDSLMKLRVAGDDYDAQRMFINQLTCFAMRTMCHIFIVAHPRKAEEGKHVGKMDIKGSGDIMNQVDNIISIWRNRDKEMKNEGRQNGQREDRNKPDTEAWIEKQRLTGIEFKRKLWFLPDCKQFTTDPDATALNYNL